LHLDRGQRPVAERGPQAREPLAREPAARLEAAIEVLRAVERADDPLDGDRPHPAVGLADDPQAVPNFVEPDEVHEASLSDPGSKTHAMDFRLRPDLHCRRQESLMANGGQQMKTVMVRYKVKPDRVAENEALVRAVYEELHGLAPEGFRYGTFRLDDGVSFVHFATLRGGESPLPSVSAFQRFQENIRDRCDEPPVLAELHEIGSYGL
jgi:hypothetical protein